MNYNYFKPVAADAILDRLAFDLKHLPTGDNGVELKISINKEITSSFSLVVEEDNISLCSSSFEGLHMGINELSCRARLSKVTKGTINRTPLFKYRGVMLDVSRGRMPKIDFLKGLIDYLSLMNINVLQLYSEDKIQLDKYPEVGEITGCFSKEEILELDEYASKRFIELQPNIQTYSHMHGVLRLPEFSALSENDTLFSFNAKDDRVIDFLDNEFREILPLFKSRTVNINMDEAYDLGTGKTKEAVESQGKGEVFYEFVMKVIESAMRHGAENIQLWGDICHKYPEFARKLPPNVTFIDWNYNPREKYDCIDDLVGLDHRFWAAPGAASWNTLFPRVHNGEINISGFARDAKKAGAEGYLMTDWGDYGHYQNYGLSFWSYLMGAYCSYVEVDKNDLDRVWNETLSLLISHPKITKAFNILGDSNLIPDIQGDFKCMSAYAFFDDLISGLTYKGNERYPKVRKSSFLSMKKAGEEAGSLIDSCISNDSYLLGEMNKIFIKDLRLSARMTEYTGDKGLIAYEIQEMYEEGKVTEENILSIIRKIKILSKRFEKIRIEFTSAWLDESREDGIDGTLYLFSKASSALAECVTFLAKEREIILKGGKSDLSRYKGDYKTLWTSDFRNMWDRAYPWQ